MGYLLFGLKMSKSWEYPNHWSSENERLVRWIGQGEILSVA